MKKKIAFIGAGFISQICHLPIYSRIRGVDIVAICDKDIILAKKVAKKFNIPKIYSNYGELLRKEKNLDAIILVVPRHDTFEVSKNILKNNVNLFSEKPMALSYRSAQILCGIAKKNNVRYVVGYMKRHDKTIQILKKIFKTKKFKIKNIKSIIYESFAGNSYANLTKHIKRKKEYKPNEITNEINSKFKNNQIKLNFLKFLNTHSHAVNLLRYLVGDITFDKKNNNKSGEGFLFFKRKNIPIILNTAYLKSVNWYENIKISFSNYRIEINFPPPMLINQPAKMKIINLRNGNVAKQFTNWSWSFENQALNFVKYISKKKSKSINEGIESLNDLKLIEKIFF